jgi:uridine kinase
MIEKIIKRDGRVVPLDRNKITLAILSAAIAVGGRDRETAERVTDDVIERLTLRQQPETYPTVEEVQDLVEKALIERGHAKTAKAFIIYRYEHALKRAGRENLTYSSDNIPYQKLWNALVWGIDHSCFSLDQLSAVIEDGRYLELVESCEEFYKREIDEAVRNLLDRIEDLRLIIVSGPSSSGKTTTTMKIADRLKERGYHLRTLNVDNYYFDLKDQPQDPTGDYDYETPQAIDLDLISQHLGELFDGKTVQIPRYNFKTGKREGISGTLSLKPRDIVLIDSLHGMYEEMTESISEHQKFKLYVETLSQLKDGEGRFIRWADIRMLRRMVRDMQFRNYSPRQTLTHWHFVRRSELRYIISNITKAHCVMNTFLLYEIPIMKNRLGDLFPGFIEEFRTDPNRADAVERAQRVHEIFERILAWSDESIVPGDSLLREFIGGSTYSY